MADSRNACKTKEPLQNLSFANTPEVCETTKNNPRTERKKPMLKPQNMLKTLTLFLTAIFCGCLAAQNINLAVLEPYGGRDVSGHISLVRDQIIQSISKKKGFHLMDRARTDQILKERDFQGNTGLISADRAMELGKMLGVDYLLTTELSMDDEDLEIRCRVFDIVSGRIVASESEEAESLTTRAIRESTRELMRDLIKELLRSVNRNPSVS
jgi:TolB-like protein